MSNVQSLTAAAESNNPSISGLSRLEVRFEAPGVKSKKVYANGRMQVRVWVFFEAVDEDGDAVEPDLTPLQFSAKLIHFHNGQPLEGESYQNLPLTGWNASRYENGYTHELPGGVDPGRAEGSHGTPIEFWVSSSIDGQAQIAAEVTMQGKVYRSNNTPNPDGRKINESVVIHAEKGPVYKIDYFTFQSHELRGSFEGDLLFRYHVGLYPDSGQVKLVGWESRQYEVGGTYPVLFCDTGLILGRDAPRSFMGVMAPSQAKELDVYVSGSRKVAVNQRAGELTVIKGIPPAYVRSEDVRVAPFYFTAFDEFGNAHNLSIEIDIPNDEFVLRRG